MIFKSRKRQLILSTISTPLSGCALRPITLLTTCMLTSKGAVKTCHSSELAEWLGCALPPSSSTWPSLARKLEWLVPQKLNEKNRPQTSRHDYFFILTFSSSLGIVGLAISGRFTPTVDENLSGWMPPFAGPSQDLEIRSWRSAWPYSELSNFSGAQSSELFHKGSVSTACTRKSESQLLARRWKRWWLYIFVNVWILW